MKPLKNIVSATIFAVVAISASAQPPIRMKVTEEIPADSVDIEHYGEKHPLRAALTITGLNAGVWSFDRFVKKSDYSYISFKTIGDNFSHGFVWDNDDLVANMFAHPYHGGLYYNSARSNGFNYWQSGLFALGGSFLWEMCMENEYPSYNDIIATPVGGMTIGEVTYRASDIVLDDRATGFERAGREAAAFLLAPTRGITRIISGAAWKHRSTSGRQFGIPNISIEYSAGVRALELKKPFFDKGLGYTSELNIEYGDRFGVSNPKPYDYFTLRADLNIHSSQPFLDQLNICGRLLGGEVLTDSLQSLSVGMYQHFDFYDSDTISSVSQQVPYRLGAPASFGAGLQYRIMQPANCAVDAYLHTNAVILGGVLSDHYKVDMRDYNLASGFSIKTGLNFVWRKHLSVSALLEYYRLFTIFGYADGTDLARANPHTLNAQGDPSATSFIVFDSRIDLRLWRRLFLTGAFSLYRRSTHYTNDLPYVSSTTSSTRIMLTYKF